MTDAETPTAPIISQRLLDRLVCPVDHQPVKLDGQELVCTVCARRYPIEAGIPNMVVE